MAKVFSGRGERWASFNAEGLLPRCILLQAVLFLPYALCLFKMRREPTLPQERRTFLSICCSMCTPKNKTLTFQGAALYFLRGTGTACKCSKFAVRYSGDLQPRCCCLLFWAQELVYFSFLHLPTCVRIY